MTDVAFPTPDGWLEYADWHGDQGTVVGRVLVRPGVRSEAFGTERHLLVHVPPSLSRGETGRRYPVIYFHDGQNLFDATTGFDGEWQVDETLGELAREGIEAIVVGVPNSEISDPPLERARPVEYSPTPYRDMGGGRADDYLAFLADTVKPLIDRDFPTLPEAAATGIAGSSLGGLVSLYGLATRPEVFGFAGVMSPAFWFAPRVLEQDAPRLRPGPRIYLDMGGREGAHEAPEEREEVSQRYLDGSRALHALLGANGFVDGDDLLYVEDPQAVHHETAWAARMPAMLRFLLRPRAAE